MSTYYLRVEGVNLNNFVYDTDDLSTIRGGSLLLRDLVEREVQSSIRKAGVTATAISTGSSAGIFELAGAKAGDAERVRLEIERGLRGHVQYRHATVMVDAVRGSNAGDFGEVRESLLAKNRFRQVQCPSLAIPSDRASVVCQVDGVRPGTDRDQKGEDEKDMRTVSRSVKVRRRYGREQKSRIVPGSEVVPDFEKLTSAPPPSYSGLDRKMAVICVDGNGFGALQDEICKTPEAQAAFDKGLQGKTKTFLDALRGAAIGEAWLQGGKLRLEVLLAAGDDFRIVVPAWLGWRVVEMFFGLAAEWEIEGRPLRYKCGLVFCHHNAPIRRITRLADELATRAKQDGENKLRYLVLESFDDAGADLDGFLRSRQLPETGAGDYAFKGADLGKIREYFSSMRAFPKNKLHDIVRDLYAGKKVTAILARALEDVPPQTREAVGRLTEVLGAAGWVHLLELWDYIAD